MDSSFSSVTPLDLKLIAMSIVSIGCFASGLLPVCLGLGARHSNSLLVSAALCFGGGVLFATSIVHILPEVQKDLPEWSHLIFCFGYLLIYFLDIVVQVVSSSGSNRPPTPLLVEPPPSYGAINPNEDCQSVSSASDSSVISPVRRSYSVCSNFSLLLAFSIHSILEGLVIGVEKTTHGVLLLLLAVCCHKIIVAFCLGAELSSDGRPLHDVLPPLSIFVFGSAIGIIIGAFIHPNSYADFSILIPVLQGLAGGTLLYVAVSEILPRERCRFAPSSVSSAVQFAFVSLGFAVMALLTSLVP